MNVLLTCIGNRPWKCFFVNFKATLIFRTVNLWVTRAYGAIAPESLGCDRAAIISSRKCYGQTNKLTNTRTPTII